MDKMNSFGDKQGAYVHRNYPELTWSMSRDQKMRECLYKYYQHFYEAHNGWLRTCTQSQRKAYLLKQLQGIHAYFGEALHKMAESSLNQFRFDKKLPRAEKLSTGVSELLNRAFVDSIKHKDRWMQKPKEHVMLAEIYYNGSLDKRMIETILDRKEKCVNNFVNSETLKEITNTPVHFLEIERLNHHELFGVKSFVKIDCLYRKGPETDGIYKIVDWKTGQEDDSKAFDQLCIYALYLLIAYNIDVKQLEISVEYLLTGRNETATVTEEDISYIKEEIGQSVLDMKSLCEDPEQNQPKPIEVFTPCPGNLCRFCEFREVCPYEYGVA